MSKKILLIANTAGCLYNFRRGLIKKLISDNYIVEVLAPFKSAEAYSDKAVEELESWGVICHNIFINSKSMNPIEDLKLISRYKKEFKRLKPDIILSYTIKANIYGSVAARKLGLPILANITGLGNLYSKETILTKIGDMLYKWGLKKTNTVFFQNQDDMDLFLERKNIKLEQCERIPGSGIDINRFCPMDREENSDNLKFLVIARLIWDKGIKYYVEAAKIIKTKYPNVEFQILGEKGVNNPSAIPEETFNEWVESGIIKYIGTSSDVRQQIKDIDCLVLPSIYREGVPRTLIEGASMGKPIITTNNVGCRDIVQDGYNGYLAKLRDSEDLATKIESFIELSDKQRIELGHNSRIKVINEFDENIVISKYMNKIVESIGE